MLQQQRSCSERPPVAKVAVPFELGRRTLLVLVAAIAVIIAAVVVIVVANSNSSNPGGPNAAPGASTSSDSADDEVVRWWSTTDSDVGSAVEAGDAEDATTVLNPDRGAYCQALDDTLAAGNGIFPTDIDVASPAYTDAVTTFVREMQAMAPEDVSTDWVVLGDMILALVESKGDAASLVLPDGATAETIEAASAQISAHAEESCGLSIQ